LKNGPARWWKVGLDVADLVAHLDPDVADVAPGVFSLRLTNTVVCPRSCSPGEVEGGQFRSLRSMRSVTWLVISSTVAPGHVACTIIDLMVKEGSS
jgi:hypothetical protein